MTKSSWMLQLLAWNKVTRKNKVPKPKKEKKPKKKEEKKSEDPCAKTEFWSLDRLKQKETQNYLQNLNVTTLNSLPQVGEVDKCYLCLHKIMKNGCIVNIGWRHIYHLKCLIKQCKDYLRTSKYPEDCPVKGCSKRLGPQQITKHLDPNELLRYEAFSLLRSGQMNRKQLLWCYNCRLIHSKKKDADLKWYKWSETSYSFQDALKFLELENKTNPYPEPQKLKERSMLDKCFIEDCRGIVERCPTCLKRHSRIHGYNYPLCICKKISEDVKNSQKEKDQSKNQ